MSWCRDMTINPRDVSELSCNNSGSTRMTLSEFHKTFKIWYRVRFVSLKTVMNSTAGIPPPQKKIKSNFCIFSYNSWKVDFLKMKDAHRTAAGIWAGPPTPRLRAPMHKKWLIDPLTAQQSPENNYHRFGNSAIMALDHGTSQLLRPALDDIQEKLSGSSVEERLMKIFQ